MRGVLASGLKSMPYEALDFYDVDSLLTDEERMVRDMVRDFVDEEVIPNIEHACRDGVFPDEWRLPLGNGSPWCSASGL